MRRVLSVIVVAILAIVVMGAYYSRRGEPLPNQAPPVAAAITQPTPVSAPSATAAPTQRPPQPTPGPSVAAPTRLRIPSISVDTRVEQVGLGPDGAMGVPEDPTEVAWYKLGPRPGENGNAVIDGHVDWGGKTMPFWGLSKLKRGDTVIVTDSSGRDYSFAVQSSKWYAAEGAPVKEIFASSSTPELTLITCGGTFDRAKRVYVDRLVVKAVMR